MKWVYHSLGLESEGLHILFVWCYIFHKILKWSWWTLHPRPSVLVINVSLHQCLCQLFSELLCVEIMPTIKRPWSVVSHIWWLWIRIPSKGGNVASWSLNWDFSNQGFMEGKESKISISPQIPSVSSCFPLPFLFLSQIPLQFQDSKSYWILETQFGQRTGL